METKKVNLLVVGKFTKVNFEIDMLKSTDIRLNTFSNHSLSGTQIH